ncbi:MAG: NUDIX hydrolase [Candidatus Marinimicrobia bacterium]|nr:NUDIX hydrolase [Candidatus Neomarinimicrobiota bacterium]
MTSNEKLVEKKLDSEEVFSGELLHVYKDQVELPDGQTSEREYIKHPGASVIIPYNNKGEILLIKQYRYPTREIMLELPAGKIDPGENAEDSIDRELAEETGFGAKEITKLSRIHSCVGYSDEVVHLFWGNALYENNLEEDEGENILLAPMDIEQAMQKVFTGEITDAKTTIGLFWADRIIHNYKFRKKFGISI